MWSCCKNVGAKNAMLLRANILEAAISDDLLDFDANSATGWGLATMVENGKELSMEWADIYNAWNVAFVSRFDLGVFMLPSLTIPSVSCYLQDQGESSGKYYLGPRITALYILVYAGTLSLIDGPDKPSTLWHNNHIINYEATQRLGAINEGYMNSWRANVIADITGADETALNMKHIVLTASPPTLSCVLACVNLHSPACRKCRMEHHDDGNKVEFDVQALANPADGRLFFRVFGRDPEAPELGRVSTYKMVYGFSVDVGSHRCSAPVLGFELCLGLVKKEAKLNPLTGKAVEKADVVMSFKQNGAEVAREAVEMTVASGSEQEPSTALDLGEGGFCPTGRQMGMFNETEQISGLEVRLATDDKGNMCKQTSVVSLMIDDVEDVDPATMVEDIPTEESTLCYGVVKSLILEHVPAIDPDEIDWILSKMNFGPPKREVLLTALALPVQRMKNLDLSMWLDTTIGCLQNNPMITRLMCDLAENPMKYSIPATTPHVNGVPITPTPKYPQWTAHQYEAAESMVQNGEAFEGDNDFAQTLKRIIHFAVVQDQIVQAVRDIPDTAGDEDIQLRSSILDQIFGAANANFPSNWERGVVSESKRNALIVAKKHAIDPFFKELIESAAGSSRELSNRGFEANPLWNCCKDTPEEYEDLLTTTSLESVTADFMAGFHDNAKAGFSTVQGFERGNTLSKNWADLYSGWDLAAVGRLPLGAFLMPKLLIPSVSCYGDGTNGPENFLGPRFIALYMSTYAALLSLSEGTNKYSTLAHANRIHSVAAMKRFGAINMQFSRQWRAKLLSEASGAPETQLGMKRIVFAVSTPTTKCIMACMLGAKSDSCGRCRMEHHDDTATFEFNLQTLVDFLPQGFGSDLLIRLFRKDEKGVGYALAKNINIAIGSKKCVGVGFGMVMKNFELCFWPPEAPTTRAPLAELVQEPKTSEAVDLLDIPARQRSLLQPEVNDDVYYIDEQHGEVQPLVSEERAEQHPHPSTGIREDDEARKLSEPSEEGYNSIEKEVQELDEGMLEDDPGTPSAKHGLRRHLAPTSTYVNLRISAKYQGEPLAESTVATRVSEWKPMILPEIPLPVPIADYKAKVSATYEAVEALPKDMTAADLMQNDAYKKGKEFGLAGALNVNPETIKVSGFEIGVATTVQRRRQLQAAAPEANTVSVTTKYDALAVDESQAQQLTLKTQDTGFATDVQEYTTATMPPSSELGFRHEMLEAKAGPAESQSYTAPYNLSSANSMMLVPGYGTHMVNQASPPPKEEEDGDPVVLIIAGVGGFFAALFALAGTCILLVKRGSKLAPEWVEDYVEEKGM
jgi:hypothetical protein